VTARFEPGSIRRREGYVELSDRGERYRRDWIPPEADRVLVLVHGFAEHTGRYDEMAMHFAERGFAVHAYDQAGHGRTVGPRGHVDRFARLPEEVVRFCEIVGAEHPGRPLTLLGHSMGGLVVTAAAAFHRPPIDRLVLSGAALDLAGGGASRRFALAVARLLSRIAPRVAFATGQDAGGLSRDPEVVRRYLEDPFVEDRMTARFAAGMNATVEALQSAGSQIEIPVLVMHGAADPICPAEGSRRLHAELSPAVAAQSALRIYPDLRHEIFNEPERAQVWQDVLDWLEA